MLREWVLPGLGFVDVDTKPRQVVRPHCAVADFWSAREDRPRIRTEERRFLNAEVVTSEIEVQVGRVSNRRNVARSVPRRPHAEELTQRRHLPRHAESTDIRDVHPDEV